jgi:hypothetical protein
MMKHHCVTSPNLFKLHCQPESNLNCTSNINDKDTETLLEASKEAHLEENTVKAKYVPILSPKCRSK